MTLNKRLILMLVLASAVPALQGCFTAVATGAGAAALAYLDRRVTENYLADEAIELRAAGRLNDRFGDRVHVNVTSYNRVVLLTGEVPDAATSAEVQNVIQENKNLRNVINELRVAGLSSFASRSNDAYLTSKVKARFLDSGKFSANHIKVVTESNSVHLLGLVTRAEADAAAEIARTTGGVQKVVRVFEYISEAEARRLDNRPPEQVPPAKAEGGPRY